MAYSYKTKSYLAYARGVDFAKAVELMDESNDHLMIPEVVNAAFSCELLMKAIVIMEKRTEDIIREHKLNELFAMMQPQTQNVVKKCASIFDWDSFMNEASNAFSEWRYLHEKDKVMHISISDLQRLYHALKKHYETTYQLATIIG